MVETERGLVFSMPEGFDPLNSSFVVVGYANVYSHGGVQSFTGEYEYPMVVTFDSLTAQNGKDGQDGQSITVASTSQDSDGNIDIIPIFDRNPFLPELSTEENSNHFLSTETVKSYSLNSNSSVTYYSIPQDLPNTGSDSNNHLLSGIVIASVSILGMTLVRKKEKSNLIE